MKAILSVRVVLTRQQQRGWASCVAAADRLQARAQELEKQKGRRPAIAAARLRRSAQNIRVFLAAVKPEQG